MCMYIFYIPLDMCIYLFILYSNFIIQAPLNGNGYRSAVCNEKTPWCW